MEEIAVTSSATAIKNFHLQADLKLFNNLDSIFFSIDLAHGVIYNADSLPKGTKVSRLVPVITFSNDMSVAEFRFKKDNLNDTVVDYLTNPTDSIDFTYPVKLNVTAADGVNTFAYTIKVNVHTQQPDTMMWDKLASSKLPSRYTNPISQKTIKRGKDIYCLIHEYNGSYTLAQTNDDPVNEWTKQELDLDFRPNVRSFEATDENLWILANDGTLLYSEEGTVWVPTEETWLSIVGPYSGVLLGLKSQDGEIYHCHYPADDSIIDSPMASQFPVNGRSSLGVINTDWAQLPIAIVVGGETMAGELSGHTWGFDGEKWMAIDNQAPPALFGPVLVKYYIYKNIGYTFHKKEFEAWFLLGGQTASGSINREVYMSLDNGVNWTLAPEMMQFPSDFPLAYQADGIVCENLLKANLSDSWNLISSRGLTRSSYQIDGFEISWDCPYLFFIGGLNTYGNLIDSMRRGVLARLQFTPLI